MYTLLNGHRCVLVDHYLSLCLGKGPRDVIANHHCLAGGLS
jgi:hypothetical protein